MESNVESAGTQPEVKTNAWTNQAQQPPPIQPPWFATNQQIIVGAVPCRVICPSCRNTITTSVQYKPSTRTHLLAVLLCLGGCICCAPIPYLVKSTQTANHHCPECEVFIGHFQQ